MWETLARASVVNVFTLRVLLATVVFRIPSASTQLQKVTFHIEGFTGSCAQGTRPVCSTAAGAELPMKPSGA